MIQDFQNIFVFPLTLSQGLFNIFIALIAGLLISFFYRWGYKGPHYSNTFVVTLVALALITSVVIMVIGNNLARAFGLVGTMSIIRFRAAIKDTQDIVYIFFSLVAGMAAGVGMHSLTLLSTLLIGGILFTMSKTNFAAQHKKEFLLQFITHDSDDEYPTYLPTFKRYCKRHKLVNVKTFGENGEVEMAYYVIMKDQNESQHFIRDLKRINTIDQVQLYFNEEEF